MSTGAFSIDQLMELAGLSVSQAGQYLSPVCRHLIRLFFSSKKLASIANNPVIILTTVARVHPTKQGRRVLVAVGPGNNGQLLNVWVLQGLGGPSAYLFCAFGQGVMASWLLDTFSTMAINLPSTIRSDPRTISIR